MDQNDLTNNAETESNFECNICYADAKNPVTTQCGHLYCWPCIYWWLNTNRAHLTCPVCKSGISEDNLIPLFVRGSSGEETQNLLGGDGTEVPPRPKGVRSNP